MIANMLLGGRITVRCMAQLSNSKHCGVVVARNDGLSVLDCETCGYAHLDSLPTRADVDAYYNEDMFYKTHGPQGWLDNEKRENLAGLWDSAYRHQASLIRKYGGHGLIDVGCGTGWFMQYYQRAYGVHYVHGIEPSATAVGWSPAPRMIYRDYEALVDKGNWFGPMSLDSLRMALVLEHVLDPRAELERNVDRYVGCSGIVELVVPNEFNSLQRKLVGQVGYDWYVQKPHINYFSKASLRRLVESIGLKVVYQSGTFPMELWWWLGYRYIGDEFVGTRCHKNRLQIERRFGKMAWSVYHLLYRTLGWGRESIIVARR
jgi:SAM-dependent methyltransferase